MTFLPLIVIHLSIRLDAAVLVSLVGVWISWLQYRRTTPADQQGAEAAAKLLQVERTRADRAEARADAAEQRERQLLIDLVALMNANGIHARTLRHDIRNRLRCDYVNTNPTSCRGPAP